MCVAPSMRAAAPHTTCTHTSCITLPAQHIHTVYVIVLSEHCAQRPGAGLVHTHHTPHRCCSARHLPTHTTAHPTFNQTSLLLLPLLLLPSHLHHTRCSHVAHTITSHQHDTQPAADVYTHQRYTPPAGPCHSQHLQSCTNHTPCSLERHSSSSRLTSNS